MKVKTYCWLALPVSSCRAAVRSLCVQAVDDGLCGLVAYFSDESALEVCIHVMCYTKRRLYLPLVEKQLLTM